MLLNLVTPYDIGLIFYFLNNLRVQPCVELSQFFPYCTQHMLVESELKPSRATKIRIYNISNYFTDIIKKIFKTVNKRGVGSNLSIGKTGIQEI